MCLLTIKDGAMDYIKNQNINRDKELLLRFGHFSKNMIKHHHLENLSEFIVHDLCSQDFFNISKAAYLVNNSDFDCLKGVVGYHGHEAFKPAKNWENQEDFSSHMKGTLFNNTVRSINDKSVDLSNSTLSDRYVHDLSDKFNIKNPIYHSWDMKHDNQGLFIFEKPEESDLVNDHLLNFLHILSFCSIF